jgi:hypothetical protein
METDDAGLVLCARGGIAAAFREDVRRHRSYVARLARSEVDRPDLQRM